MIVYRVENFQGLGPYQVLGENLNLDNQQIHNTNFSGEHQPSPENDGIPRCAMYRFSHFAFRSLDQLKKWFSNLDWDHKDFYVTTYHVSQEDYFLGNNQLVFTKEKAKLLDRMSFSSI